MHFDFSITFGNMLTIAAIVGLGWRIERFLNMMLIEHDLLFVEYCKTHQIDINSFPTRQRARRLL